MTEFLEWLQQLDQRVFLWINRGWSHEGLDLFFPNITDLHKTAAFKWLVPITLLSLFIWKRKKMGLVMFFGFLVTMGLSDLIGGKLIKPYFARPRPNMTEHLDVILRSPHFGGYSFTSNHASNMFCMAAFLAFFFPAARWPLFILAGLIGISRVYVGVHYPSDVILGALWGGMLGFVMAKLTNYCIQKYRIRRQHG